MEEAWRAITANPADVLGISDRVGALEAGRDGDLVIWNKDPLTAVGATAAITVIDGKIVKDNLSII
jgi:imidazolonepropionase-like amidohydrolase